MYQPFNGLEVFDPAKYFNTTGSLPAETFQLPEQCALEAKLGCINGSSPQISRLAFGSIRSVAVS
jgi:hypothetical protein